MESLTALALLFLCVLPVTVNGWGEGGSFVTCKIAQTMLSKAATDAVKTLLPEYAKGDLASLCSWADEFKYIYPWSLQLHYINTPFILCLYRYNKICEDGYGVKERCEAAAIKNYTTQLLNYGKPTSKYNPTKHCSSFRISKEIFISMQVLEDNVNGFPIVTFYSSKVETYIDAIQTNITAEQVQTWEICSGNQITCPEKYATEGIKEACYWANKEEPQYPNLARTSGLICLL